MSTEIYLRNVGDGLHFLVSHFYHSATQSFTRESKRRKYFCDDNIFLEQKEKIVEFYLPQKNRFLIKTQIGKQTLCYIEKKQPFGGYSLIFGNTPVTLPLWITSSGQGICPTCFPTCHLLCEH